MMDKISHSLFFFMMAFTACMVLMARDSSGDRVCVKTYDVTEGPVSSVYLQDWMGSEMDWSLTMLPKEGATEFQALDYNCQHAPALDTARKRIHISAKPDNGKYYPEYVRICLANGEHHYHCPWKTQCESIPFHCFIGSDIGKVIFCYRRAGNGGCD